MLVLALKASGPSAHPGEEGGAELYSSQHGNEEKERREHSKGPEHKGAEGNVLVTYLPPQGVNVLTM